MLEQSIIENPCFSIESFEVSCSNSLAQNNLNHIQRITCIVFIFLEMKMKRKNKEDETKIRFSRFKSLKIYKLLIKWIKENEKRKVVIKFCPPGQTYDRRTLQAALNCRPRAEKSIRQHYHHHHRTVPYYCYYNHHYCNQTCLRRMFKTMFKKYLKLFEIRIWFIFSLFVRTCMYNITISI